MGDLDNFMPIFKEEKGGANMGMLGGNRKYKVMKKANGGRHSLLRKGKVVMKKTNGGRHSLLHKGKVVMKEKLKDYEEVTPSTYLIIVQSSLKKVHVSVCVCVFIYALAI